MDDEDEYSIPAVVPINRSTGPLDKEIIDAQEKKYLSDLKRNSPTRTFYYNPKLGQIE